MYDFDHLDSGRGRPGRPLGRVAVDLITDFKSVRSGPDQLDDHLVADQRLATPIWVISANRRCLRAAPVFGQWDKLSASRSKEHET